MFYYLVFFYSQFFVNLPAPTSDFSGQTVVVTDGDKGLGLEAAKLLVQLRASKVILAVRSIKAGQDAAAHIIESTRARLPIVEVWPFDLTSTESIQEFARRAAKLDRLDAVILNAGIESHTLQLINGMEAHVAVNLVGPVLLGLLLLPKLRGTASKLGAPTRMTFVGSNAQYGVSLDELKTPGSLLELLSEPDGVKKSGRSAVVKLFLLYAVREFAMRSPVTADSNVIISYNTPGLCWSPLMLEEVSLLHFIQIWLYMLIFARSTAQGAIRVVDAARPDLGKEAHGKLLMDCKVTRNGGNVDSREGRRLQRKLADELYFKLEQISPRALEVLR